MKQILLKLMISFFSLFIVTTCDGQIYSHKKSETGETWSGIAGDPNFSLSDRLAIKDVMHAYSIYWDNRDLDNFLGLFTKDKRERINKKKTQKKLDYFKSMGLQRRHLMANSHFLEQNDSSAYIKQYALLVSILNKKEFSPVTTVVYDVWLVKEDGVWKISNYKINLDGEIDIKPKLKG